MRTAKKCDKCNKPLWLRVNYIVGTVEKNTIYYCAACYHNYKKEQVRRNYAEEQRKRCMTTCLSPSELLTEEQAESIIKINGGIPKKCDQCNMLSAIQKYFKQLENDRKETD